MLDSLLFQLMLIGAVGIGSQWIAWFSRLPAIVVMSVAGLLIGPIFGLINPSEAFGDLYGPIVSIAVAIILFEGSLNLDFRGLQGLQKPVYRIITIGALLAWILGSLTAHFVAGLSWEVSFIIGGLLIVTGPTVILPLLRQAKLKPRPARILKWEGIVVDPFGALLAVFAFEIIRTFTSEESAFVSLVNFFMASLFAVFLGILFGRIIGWTFERGHVPEFLKSPVVLSMVIASFVISDVVMHETGLLAVTAMGMTIANLRISSISDMQHFKENISVLLISGIFIMLTASLDRATLMQIFDPQIIAYVLLMLFLVRPLSIWLSTIGTDLTFGEKALVGWIAPRGIVALTVAGYFANVLEEYNYAGASIITPLTFALVFATVCFHGFTIGPLARKLNLSKEGLPGVLFVGGSSFTTNLAQKLKEMNVPVLIADSSFEHLFNARKAGIAYYRGEILSEQSEYSLDMTPYNKIIAATDRDSYNSLVCTTFVPEFGRKDLFQLSWHQSDRNEPDELMRKVGGRVLFEKGATFEELNWKVDAGYVFKLTSLTKEYSYQSYLNDRAEDVVLIGIQKPTGRLEFFALDNAIKPEAGDKILSLSPPSNQEVKKKEELKEQSREKQSARKPSGPSLN
ncbi:cation:proton antiporter [Marinococcus halotolerans]|uniref:cation:proton antiporter n=1 Tax=Marinococcus halotolerans TaxID=301092 RepID=UPI0003B78085|nr:sodium:proton antiporter [Marinococcus halotolerans]